MGTRCECHTHECKLSHKRLASQSPSNTLQHTSQHILPCSSVIGVVYRLTTTHQTSASGMKVSSNDSPVSSHTLPSTITGKIPLSLLDVCTTFPTSGCASCRNIDFTAHVVDSAPSKHPATSSITQDAKAWCPNAHYQLQQMIMERPKYCQCLSGSLCCQTALWI